MKTFSSRRCAAAFAALAAVSTADAEPTLMLTAPPLSLQPDSRTAATPALLELSAHPNASAPPVTSVSVYAVYSTQYGNWEVIPSGQYTTTYDHGGTTLNVAVLEIGYGTANATMQGTFLDHSKNYTTQSVCISGGYYTTSCPAGAAIVGFLRYWDVSGYQSGQFTESDRSYNSPFNTVSTYLNIR